MAQNFTVFLTFVLKTLWANSWRNCSFIHHQFILRKRCYKGCTGDPDTVNTGYWSGLSVWPNTGYWMSGLSVWSDTGYAAFFKTKLFLTFHSFFFLINFIFFIISNSILAFSPHVKISGLRIPAPEKVTQVKGPNQTFPPMTLFKRALCFTWGCVSIECGWAGVAAAPRAG